MNTTQHKAKRIRAGKYIYRGYEINCCGYYPPEQKVVWEAVDEYGCGFAHNYSLKGVKKLIDLDLDKK
jgi:hypothetical protein